MSAGCSLDHINQILEKANALDQGEDQVFGGAEGDERRPKELANAQQRIKRIFKGQRKYP